MRSINGTIVSEDMGSIEILSSKDKNEIVVVWVTGETYTADAVNGKPASIGERNGDDVVAYYKTDEMGENSAVALIVNIPADYPPPVYAQAMEANHENGQVSLMTDKGVIVTMNGDTPIEAFLPEGEASIGSVQGGSDLLLWYKALTMSIPARTTADKAVILGKGKSTVKVSNAELDKSLGWLSGKFPQVTGIQNPILQKQVEDALLAIYDEAVRGRANNEGSLSFSYSVKKHEGLVSIIVHSSLNPGNTSSDNVRTVVFNDQRILSLKDIMGEGAYEKADAEVRKAIAGSGKGDYFEQPSGYKYVTDKTSFYVVKDGTPVVIFDKYSIAPGVMGTPEFKINME